jgi:hypothetical protein
MPEGKLTGLTIMKTKPFAPKNRVLNPFEAADAQLLAAAFSLRFWPPAKLTLINSSVLPNENFNRSLRSI